MLQVKIEAPKIAQEIDAKLKAKIIEFLDELSRFAEQRMRELAPERTGKLRKSIRRRLNLARLEGEVGPTVPYAVYVEFGTRPHIIRPVRAQALRFEVEGQIVFAKLVRHPGTKGQFFVRQTAEETEREASHVFRKVWST